MDKPIRLVTLQKYTYFMKKNNFKYLSLYGAASALAIIFYYIGKISHA